MSIRKTARLGKASDNLAGELRERILAGQIGEGTALPNERTLAETSGLSRASVREALRTLDVEGLITTRPGRNGGSSARLPTQLGVARSLNLFIRGRNIRLAALLETREAIEPHCAHLAAQHRNDADLAALDVLQTQLEASFADIPAFLTINRDWHLAVVEASHNELLIAFMRAISDALHAGTDLDDFNSDAVRGTVLRSHRRVNEAIAAGDAAAAQRRMQRHVAAYAREVRSRPAKDDQRQDDQRQDGQRKDGQ